MEEIRILTPCGMLGYGFPIKWFRRGLSMDPHVIAVDSGSTDSGPHKLATGVMTCSKESYTKDISLLLDAINEKKIPLFISSAGGAGSDAQVDIFLDMIREISRQKGYHFKIAVIYGEINKNTIKEKLRSGKIAPCGPVSPLTEEEIDLAATIVAQMGVEPYLKVLNETDVDIIVSGRTYDPVPIAAMPIKQGFDLGLAWHMGKIMECGALCAEPAGKVMFGIIRSDHFILEPGSLEERCTTWSVAAHTLYEKSHPYLLPGPGGTLDLSNAKFEQIDDRRVKVSGSKFIPSDKYAVKLEGAKRVGFRSIFIAGVRDPILIEHIDDVLERVNEDVKDYFKDISGDKYQMIYHLYGKNGVMGEYEPTKNAKPLELCVILEVAAITQELATAICSRARTELLHCPYEGRIATAGNIAIPFTPLEIPLGEVCA
ncbi:MAG: acyclic terpene utilization AtuA family protein, partial [Synergistota bacterium]|nr:acyclic terpene utilization AtuA family protein [Synergistota bacterium]